MTDIEKPQLFMDVDGVLSIIADEADPLKYIKYRPYCFFPHNALANIVRLNKIFDLHWLTAWNEKANAELMPILGMPELTFPVVSSYTQDPTVTGRDEVGYKTPALTKFYHDRPDLRQRFVFIDDDIVPGDYAYLQRKLSRAANYLLIKPDSDVGITNDHVEQAIDWAMTSN